MPAPGYGQPQYPYPSAPTQRKDSTVALLLELIGYAGFLGIGHIYAGRTSRGIALLVGGFIYLIASAVLTIVLVGICMFVAWLAVPILSGLWIKNDLDKTNAMLRR
jgi:TM2 domain-containing membrane protein YozV